MKGSIIHWFNVLREIVFSKFWLIFSKFKRILLVGQGFKFGNSLFAYAYNDPSLYFAC